MATVRQEEFLRDLGVDARFNFGDLPKEEASSWIEELKALATRANLPVGRPLTVESLRRAGARTDALTLPPSMSAGPNLAVAEGRTDLMTDSPRNAPMMGPTPADEAWWKLEITASVTMPGGRSLTVGVGGSEHRRRGLSEKDAHGLGVQVREVLRRELEKARESIATEDDGGRPAGTDREVSRGLP